MVAFSVSDIVPMYTLRQGADASAVASNLFACVIGPCPEAPSPVLCGSKEGQPKCLSDMWKRY